MLSSQELQCPFAAVLGKNVSLQQLAITRRSNLHICTFPKGPHFQELLLWKTLIRVRCLLRHRAGEETRPAFGGCLWRHSSWYRLPVLVVFYCIVSCWSSDVDVTCCYVVSFVVLALCGLICASSDNAHPQTLSSKALNTTKLSTLQHPPSLRKPQHPNESMESKHGHCRVMISLPRVERLELN